MQEETETPTPPLATGHVQLWNGPKGRSVNVKVFADSHSETDVLRAAELALAIERKLEGEGPPDG